MYYKKATELCSVASQFKYYHIFPHTDPVFDLVEPRSIL
jgi:hypothetical protein